MSLTLQGFLRDCTKIVFIIPRFAGLFRGRNAHSHYGTHVCMSACVSLQTNSLHVAPSDTPHSNTHACMHTLCHMHSRAYVFAPFVLHQYSMCLGWSLLYSNSTVALDNQRHFCAHSITSPLSLPYFQCALCLTVAPSVIRAHWPTCPLWECMMPR